MPSMRDLLRLPGPADLRRLSQSIAMLDAILERDWERRYYSFNCQWDVDEALASMRDGSGDHYFILFTAAWVAIKGFAHESPMGRFAVDSGRPWPGVLDRLPAPLRAFREEPAFSIQDTSFCVWREREDAFWRIGDVRFPESPDPDGSEDILAILDGNPQTYVDWAEGYYEVGVPIEAVTRVYLHVPLDQAIVHQLNPTIDIQELAEDLSEIGYPLVSQPVGIA